MRTPNTNIFNFTYSFTGALTLETVITEVYDTANPIERENGIRNGIEHSALHRFERAPGNL